MRIIADVGNPQYYIRRVREELLQDKPDLQFAIRLLALASAEYQESERLASLALGAFNADRVPPK